VDNAAAAIRDPGHNKLEGRAKKIIEIIPDEYVGPDKRPDPDGYTRLLRITDYVSGMTDSYALSLYRKLKGIELPQFQSY
jgi:dGTPase